MAVTTKSGKIIAKDPKPVENADKKEAILDPLVVIHDTDVEVLTDPEQPVAKNEKGIFDKSPVTVKKAAIEKGKEKEGLKLFMPISRPLPHFRQRLKKKVEDVEPVEKSAIFLKMTLHTSPGMNRGVISRVVASLRIFIPLDHKPTPQVKVGWYDSWSGVVGCIYRDSPNTMIHNMTRGSLQKVVVRSRDI
ncbi:hypothetical protein HAX54_029993 [Datura stramonium]|uniref:Uncharacterized protein n=1 Tax=Datura stramonium TaxID=4076 RepID=A0ABS8V6V9_DATST|nr:hypothetical protein [Datura stramonium]